MRAETLFDLPPPHSLHLIDRALSIADDDQMADVWYNIGHIGISLGDLGLAYQAFKVAVSVEPQHGEALNNIAVLEMRRQKFDFAKSCFHTACEVCPHSFEPFYNSALMAYRMVRVLTYYFKTYYNH